MNMHTLYINGLKPSSIIISNIERYETHVKNKTIFYSDKGVFEIIKDKLHKLNCKDGNTIIQNLTVDNYNNLKIIDTTSILTPEKVYYQLPYSYIVKRIKKHTYRLLDHAEVNMVIETENDTPFNVYFKTKLPFSCEEVQSTISTFLSKLNFYQ